MQDGHDEQKKATKRILVVDDNVTNLLYLCKVLTKAGYEPISATSAQEAVKNLAVQPFDLILADVMMPEISGIELVRRIRQAPGLSELPILMCSAAKDRDTVVAAAKLNVQGYVLKPIDRTLLLERLSAIFNRPMVATGETTPAPA